MDRMVEVLSENGHDVQLTRNSKVTEEQYQILLSAFEQDKSRKDAAEAVSLQKKEEKEAMRAEREVDAPEAAAEAPAETESTPEKTSEAETPAETPQVEVKTVEETPEVKEEWISLFDGTSTVGWRAYNGDKLPPQWVIVDDALTFSTEYKNEEDFEGGKDIIYAAEEFDNFGLYFEWKVPEGGNSGIFYHLKEIPRLPSGKIHLKALPNNSSVV